MQGVGNMTNDRNEAKTRRPQLRTYARLCKSIWMATAIVAAVALACQEQEPSGLQGGPDWNPSCNVRFRGSLIIHRNIHTAERGNDIVRAHQEATHLDCDPDTWNPKISSTPQSCHHAEWEDRRPVPESLAQAAENDSDGLTKDKEGNVLVEFSEPPTGFYFAARCWIYHGPDQKWDRSVD